MLTSRDLITMHITIMEIQCEQAFQRSRFLPMMFTRDVTAEETGVSRRLPVKKTKAKVIDAYTNKRSEHAENLPLQG